MHTSKRVILYKPQTVPNWHIHPSQASPGLSQSPWDGQ